VKLAVILAMSVVSVLDLLLVLSIGDATSGESNQPQRDTRLIEPPLINLLITALYTRRRFCGE
jgi:hypothetical protein